MRGDSLRDFYAKTLALMGLALLAGVGAAVDYWPVSSPLPSIASVRLPQPEVPVLTQRLDQQIPAPVAAPVVRAPRPAILARNIGTARFLTASVANPVTPAEPPSERPAPVPDVVVAVAETNWPALLVVQEMTWLGPEPPVQMAPSPGFIGGALRKTKESIIRTGAVTGSTIAEAFRGVVGAFKKVSPF